jgi:hypothetical protein
VKGSDIPNGGVKNVKPQHLAAIDSMTPQPLFSEHDSFGFFTPRFKNAEGESTHLDLEFPTLDGQPRLAEKIVPVVPQYGALTNAQASFAFIGNDSGLLVKQNGKGLVRVMNANPGGKVSNAVVWKEMLLDETGQRIVPLAASVKNLDRAYNPWAYSPIAANMAGTILRSAWLSDRGVWVVESKDGIVSHPILGLEQPLFMGERGGSKLQFSKDGNFLVLQQQPLFGGPMRVRVWNISERQRAWLMEEADVKQLQSLACAIVRANSNAYDDPRANILAFKIGANVKMTCE